MVFGPLGSPLPGLATQEQAIVSSLYFTPPFLLKMETEWDVCINKTYLSIQHKNFFKCQQCIYNAMLTFLSQQSKHLF